MSIDEIFNKLYSYQLSTFTEFLYNIICYSDNLPKKICAYAYSVNMLQKKKIVCSPTKIDCSCHNKMYLCESIHSFDVSTY